jgi:hypothetical protein
VHLHRLTAPAGASSPHTAIAKRSALTASFRCNSSTLNTARAFAPPNATTRPWRRTSNAPRTANSNTDLATGPRPHDTTKPDCYHHANPAQAAPPILSPMHFFTPVFPTRARPACRRDARAAATRWRVSVIAPAKRPWRRKLPPPEDDQPPFDVFSRASNRVRFPPNRNAWRLCTHADTVDHLGTEPAHEAPTTSATRSTRRASPR